MAWTQDADTQDWVWQDDPPALVEQAAPYNPDRDQPTPKYPVLPASDAPTRTDEGSYQHPGLRTPPSAGPMAPLYQNDDQRAITEWERGVRARGNEVRVTGVGTFEVDKGGRIVSTAPMPYRMN